MIEDLKLPVPQQATASPLGVAALGHPDKRVPPLDTCSDLHPAQMHRMGWLTPTSSSARKSLAGRTERCPTGTSQPGH